MASSPNTRVHRRRAVVVALLLAAVLFMAGSFIPPLTIRALKPLPTGSSTEYSTVPAPTLAVTPDAMATRTVPEANADRPECRDTPFDELPHSCLVTEGQSHERRVTTTSEAEARSEVNVDSVLQVTLSGEVVSEIQDHVRLERTSAYPVPDPVSSLKMSVPGVSVGIAPRKFVREGLQYFFPFTLERRSYDYFDITSQQTVPLDYVDEVTRNGHVAYEFHHTITAVPVADAVARSFLQPKSATAPPLPSGDVLASQLPPEQRGFVDSLTGRGPASRFYTDEEMKRFGHDPADTVVVAPYYSVQRTVWVESRSGTVLDVAENIHVYLAANQREAEDLSFDHSPAHAVYLTESRWDESTLAAQRETADVAVERLRLLQIFAYLTKSAAFLLAAWAVVMILRNRREEAAS